MYHRKASSIFTDLCQQTINTECCLSQSKYLLNNINWNTNLKFSRQMHMAGLFQYTSTSGSLRRTEVLYNKKVCNRKDVILWYPIFKLITRRVIEKSQNSFLNAYIFNMMKGGHKVIRWRRSIYGRISFWVGRRVMIRGIYICKLHFNSFFSRIPSQSLLVIMILSEDISFQFNSCKCNYSKHVYFPKYKELMENADGRTMLRRAVTVVRFSNLVQFVHLINSSAWW